MSVEQITRICAECNNQPNALIEILHETQHKLGYLPSEVLVEIANILNISRADIHGIISFYDDFRREPPTGQCIKICRAEACQAVGGETLAKHAQDNNIEAHDVYCLGNCALGPAVMIDDKLHGRVDTQKFDALLKGQT